MPRAAIEGHGPDGGPTCPPSPHDNAVSHRGVMRIEQKDGMFCVDASLLGRFFDLTPEDVLVLMKKRIITSLCERGIDDHDGEFRLSFFYGRRQLRLTLDAAGTLLHHKLVDIGGPRRPPVKFNPGL
jgi:hypothetical protein